MTVRPMRDRPSTTGDPVRKRVEVDRAGCRSLGGEYGEMGRCRGGRVRPRPKDDQELMEREVER